MRIGLAGCFAAAALASSAACLAHHSFAMFDQTKKLPLTGTVHDFQWTNPHAYIDIDVPNAGGGIDLWKVELNSPNNLERQGWHMHTIRSGDKVTVVVNPLRDGAKGGLALTVTLPNGKVLQALPPRVGKGAPINVPQVR